MNQSNKEQDVNVKIVDTYTELMEDKRFKSEVRFQSTKFCAELFHTFLVKFVSSRKGVHLFGSSKTPHMIYQRVSDIYDKWEEYKVIDTKELLELISTIWLEYDNYDRMEEVLDEIKKDNQKEN